MVLAGRAALALCLAFAGQAATFQRKCLAPIQCEDCAVLCGEEDTCESAVCSDDMNHCIFTMTSEPTWKDTPNKPCREVTALTSSAADPQTQNACESCWPDRGIDYATGEKQSRIFDMSETSGEIAIGLASSSHGLRMVAKPVSIDDADLELKCEKSVSSSTTESFTTFESESAASFSATWSQASTIRGKMGQKFSQKHPGMDPPSGEMGYEVGGSRSTEMTFARETIAKESRSMIKTTVECQFAEITMKKTMTKLADSFARRVATLPRGLWAEMSEADKTMYSEFFHSVGTHYAETSKLAGSYEQSIAGTTCGLYTSIAQGGDMQECASIKVNWNIADIPIKAGSGGTDGDVSDERCRGLTFNGARTSDWSTTIFQKVTKRHGGSSFQDEVPADLNAWYSDIQQNPAVIPKKLTSLTSLLRELKHSWGVPDGAWEDLKNMGMTYERLEILVDNLDEAFIDKMLLDLEFKMGAGRCTLTCGQCGTPPDADCTCPAATEATCGELNPNAMKVNIDRVTFSTNHPHVEQLKVRVTNWPLGSSTHSFTGSDNAKSVTFDVGSEFEGVAGDSFNVHIYDQAGIFFQDECIGSGSISFEHAIMPDTTWAWVQWGFGQQGQWFSGGCGKHMAGLPPKGGIVAVVGSISYPGRCETFVGSAHGLKFFWTVSAVLAVFSLS